MVYSRDIRCGPLRIEVNSCWVRRAMEDMEYEELDDDDWDWKFDRYCEDMELEIYRQHHALNYQHFNWGEWFLENYDCCEYFDDLWERVEDDE